MRKPSVEKAYEALKKADYAIETVLLIRLPEGVPGAIRGLPDEPQIASGKLLADNGLDLYRLIKEEYIYPVSDEPLVERAMEVIEEWQRSSKDLAQHKSSKSSLRRRHQRSLEVIR